MAVHNSFAAPASRAPGPNTPSTAGDPAEPLTRERALEHLQRTALIPGPVSRVGLELEAHLVDLTDPARRVPWPRIAAVRRSLGPLPGRSALSVEPGGQLELSGPPTVGVAAAVAALRQDQAVVRTALSAVGLGLAAVGADPARAPERVNPDGRYEAMEAHFAANGRAGVGAAMMCSTAALQLNLDAGPAAGWVDRVRLAHRLGPVLVALSANSPWLAGRHTGWRSNRQRIWADLDARPMDDDRPGADPTRDWADYALAARVMLVCDDGRAVPVRGAVPFDTWLAGEARLGGRAPTVGDLDYHLTTLFPPVRLRGFLELRYLDAAPERCWPELAAIVAALLDDPVAADAAAEAVEPVAGRWRAAARIGLADPALRRAAERCLAAAGRVVPDSVLAGYAERVATGRDAGTELAERAHRDGPLAVLEEEAHA